MSKFFIVSLIALLVVVGLVVYLKNKKPEEAKINQANLENQSLNNEIIPEDATRAAEASSSVKGTSSPKQWSTAPKMTLDQTKSYNATIKTTKGDMTFELYASEDPITVNNFVFLASNGFYNDTKFHRIIKDFMVQGGDSTGTGMGGPGYKFDDEKVTREYTRGTLAMANSGPNTNGSQFFIMTGDNPLPKSYTIFGKLTAGDDILQKIANTPVITSAQGELSKPTQDVLVTSVVITEK